MSKGFEKNRRKNKKKKLAFRKEKKNFFPAIVAIILLICACGYTQYRCHLLQQTKNELEVEIAGLENKISGEEKREEDLKEFEIYTHTKKYAEEVAKDILGYVYDDEIIFKPEK